MGGDSDCIVVCVCVCEKFSLLSPVCGPSVSDMDSYVDGEKMKSLFIHIWKMEMNMLDGWHLNNLEIIT